MTLEKYFPFEGGIETIAIEEEHRYTNYEINQETIYYPHESGITYFQE
jgi:hypothetical protein